MSEVLWYWTGRGCGVPCIDTYNLIYFIVDFVDARGGPERLSLFSVRWFVNQVASHGLGQVKVGMYVPVQQRGSLAMYSQSPTHVKYRTTTTTTTRKGVL